MALLIVTDDCTDCDACVEPCPNEAISVRDTLYIIDRLRCTECVGHFDDPQCIEVCPSECILPDPDFPETPEELQAKYESLQE
jgi:ferredoxin